MSYSAAALANFFIQRSLDTKVSITNMHLQKMVFFAHAIYFHERHVPLFSDVVTAWQHGPVVESLYHSLKHYGNSAVGDLILIFEPTSISDPFPGRIYAPIIQADDYDTLGYLSEVWDKLSKMETWRLRAMSHAEGGAWWTTIKNYAAQLGKNDFNPLDDNAVEAILPRNLTILDPVIEQCGR